MTPLISDKVQWFAWFISGGGTLEEANAEYARLSGEKLRSNLQPENNNLVLNIEHFSTVHGVVFIKGWIFHKQGKQIEVSIESENNSAYYFQNKFEKSPDVEAAHGDKAKKSRFNVAVSGISKASFLNLKLVFKVKEGFLQSKKYTLIDIWKYGTYRGPYRTFVPDYFINNTLLTKCDVLEIGSRSRSGICNKDNYITDANNYTGADVLDGHNVDVVCDAHHLSKHFDTEQFDSVFSLNVFEHIAMPWQVALEINKVLKIGGTVLIFTHQTFPLHDLPCDYWRFSHEAWKTIFNPSTGFEIIETDLSEPASIIPNNVYEGSLGVTDGLAYMHSGVIAKKVSNSSLSWDVDINNLTSNQYPE